jgi:hypothetical protein
MYVSIITLLVYLDLYHRILEIAVVYTIGLYSIPVLVARVQKLCSKCVDQHKSGCTDQSTETYEVEKHGVTSLRVVNAR